MIVETIVIAHDSDCSLQLTRVWKRSNFTQTDDTKREDQITVIFQTDRGATTFPVSMPRLLSEIALFCGCREARFDPYGP